MLLRQRESKVYKTIKRDRELFQERGRERGRGEWEGKCLHYILEDT